MFNPNNFDKLFGNARDFTPDPDDLESNEFDTLDEEDAGGEDQLEDIDCTGLPEEDGCSVTLSVNDSTTEDFDNPITDDFNFDALPKFDDSVSAGFGFTGGDAPLNPESGLGFGSDENES